MIVAANSLIALICLGALFIDYKLVSGGNYLLIHLSVLACKLIMVSFVIIAFSMLVPAGRKIFILSGAMILVLLHFIEGFVIQKKLTKIGKTNV